MTEQTNSADAIAFENVSLAFDDKVVLDHLSFTVPNGRLKVILGASGSGKSSILKLTIGLLKPDEGDISIEGKPVTKLTDVEWLALRPQIGMVFQEGALFDSLTVRENTGYRLYETTDMPLDEIDKRVTQLLNDLGLSGYEDRLPGELSGGERRRVAIGRALCTEPRILLYDEPTAGLDPATSIVVASEIVRLRDTKGVSGILVTHELNTAFFVAEHEAVQDGEKAAVRPKDDTPTDFLLLKDGKVAFSGSAKELHASDDPAVKAFLA